MSVNREYWSGSETKTVYGVDVELPLFPVNSATLRTYPYFANSFVAKTKDNGVDWKEPIDSSYSFCRTDNNYCGCKSILVCGYATSYNPAAQRSRKYNIGIDSFDIGLGIKSGVASTTDKYIQYTTSSITSLKCTTIPNTNTENKKPDTLTYNSESFYKFNKNFAPILKVNPRDYMLVIMVDCAKLKDDKTLADFATDSNNIFNGTIKCDLKTYLLYYYVQGYTIITGVWCFVVANPTAPTNIGSNIAPVLYSTNIIDIDYTGSDNDNYTFSAKLPSMVNTFSGTNFKYTPDDEKTIGSSFSLQDDRSNGEIVIAGSITAATGYITYPYHFGTINVGDYFKIYETNSKNYLLSAATIDDFGGIDAFREWCRKQTAYFGLPFRENRDFSNVDEALTDERIMWGIIDSNGITHGEYTTGTNNTKNPLYNSDNLQDDSGWKPGGGGGGDERFSGSISLHSYGADIQGFNSYVIPTNTFNQLIQKLNIKILSMGSEISMDDEVYQTFLGSEPYAAILGAKMLPFGFNLIGGISDNKYPVYIGNWNSEITANVLHLTTSVVNMEWGSKRVPKTFNCFLDYEPYTSLTLDLPYASSLSLPPSIFVGHDLRVRSAIDIFANSIMHYVFVDDILFTTAIGNCCFDMPIATYSGSKYANAIWESTNAQINNVFNTASAIGGNMTAGLISASIHPKGTPQGTTNAQSKISYALAGVSAVSGIINGSMLYEYQKQQRPEPAIVQMSSGNANFSNIQHPVLIIQTPKYIDAYNESEFSRLNGFACHYTDKIGNYTGFTQIVAPDLKFNAPTDVKVALAEALSEGVIL